MISGPVAHTTGDIWIAAYGANNFEQAPLLTGRERFLALSAGHRIREPPRRGFFGLAQG